MRWAGQLFSYVIEDMKQ